MPAQLIDNPQNGNWSPDIFAQLREGGVDAVQVIIACHETLREFVLKLQRWNLWLEEYPELIFKGTRGDDVRLAQKSGQTAVFFGFQSPGPIEGDIGRVEICLQLIRFMQFAYKNRSLLATGCYEEEDKGLARMGRQVVAEMNRVGIVVDTSHSSDRSTFEANAQSSRPIAISHANTHWWHKALRNKSDDVLSALTASGSMLGFSLYPHHLAGGSDCTLESFCGMIEEAAGRYGAETLGIGSDLCQGQLDRVMEWMRVGRWSKVIDYGEGSRLQTRDSRRCRRGSGTTAISGTSVRSSSAPA